MRVVELRAENFMGLKAVEITPTEHLVTIAGRNGQGKTSVLNALWATLAGGDASRRIPAPVRQGSDRAEVTVDLGELRVTRTWTDDGHTALRVVAKDGHRVTSPQAVLDKLVGALTFDPLTFSRMSEREQVAALLQVVDLPFDPDALDRQRADLFARRTDINREVRRLEGQLANTPETPAGLPEREVSVADIADEYAAAQRAEMAHLELARTADDTDKRAKHLRETAARLEQQITHLRGQLEKTHADITTVEDSAVRQRTAVRESFAALPDVMAIANRMRTVEETNRAVRVRDEWAALTELAAEQQAAADGLTKQIRELDEQRADALAAAAMPLPGLSFDDRGVTLDGVPLKACSGAEQLRASVALAMAANPRLRVIRVTDGSLLDDDGLALIAGLAADRDYQVWLEKVDSTGEVGIVIEDGMVAAVNV